jgi:hypothetical protein
MLEQGAVDTLSFFPGGLTSGRGGGGSRMTLRGGASRFLEARSADHRWPCPVSSGYNLKGHK